MIEKARDRCSMTRTEHGKLRCLGLIGARENRDKNRHDMSKRNTAEVFTELIFHQALANRPGIEYAVFHKTSLPIRLSVDWITAAYS